MVKMEIDHDKEVEKMAEFLKTQKLVIFAGCGVVEKDFENSINVLFDVSSDHFSIDFLFNVRHELVVRGLIKKILRMNVSLMQQRQLQQSKDGLIVSALSCSGGNFFSIAGFNIHYEVPAFNLLSQKIALIPEINCSLVTFSP